MKIAKITPIAVQLPLIEPIKMAGIEMTKSDNVFARIETDDGLVGWGEASAAPSMTGETVQSMVAAIEHLTPYLDGRDPADFTENLAVMDRHMYGNASAKTALEMALYDVAGKAAQKPVAELLGQEIRRTRMPVLWMLATGKVDQDLATAMAKKDEGYRSFKIKTGTNPVAYDIGRSVQIRAAVNAGIQLSADANQGWSVDDAIDYVEGIGDALDFVEQPVMGSNIDGMVRVAERASVPIGADEGLHSIADINHHHDTGAAAGGSLKMIKLGGVTRASAAAALCDAIGMKVNMAGKVAESSVSTAAVLHLSAAAPSLDWGLSVTQQYIAKDVVRNPIQVVDGHANLPEGAGLGVDVDEDVIQRLAVRC